MTRMFDEFFNFIYNRQLIWYKRFNLKESPPWTSDPVLQRYKIINIYRELDRCTLYILQKLKHVKNREKLLINVIFYRFFNQDQLYENLEVEPFDKIPKRKILESFSKRKSEGKTIFSNAYLISSGKKGQPKHVSIIESLERIDLKKTIEEIDASKTPREALEVLQKISMIGPFLACEVWTDLSYFKFFKQGWNDNDFVNIGPGAKWGLEIIFEKKLSKKEQEEKLLLLYRLQKEYLNNIKWKKISYKNAFSNSPFLSITNIEGSLCEFRKYWRIRSGKGKRRYFNPSCKF